MEATSVPQQFRMIDFTIYRDANGNAFVAYTPTPTLTFNPPQPTTPEISCLAPSFFYATPPRATPTITSPLPISTHDQPFTFPTFTLSPQPFNMNPLIPESPLQAQPEPPSLTSKSLPTPSKTPTSTKPRVACKFQDCGKTFSSVSHLNRHMKIHTGNRDFLCPFTPCKWSFVRADHLRQHALKVHGVVCKKRVRASLVANEESCRAVTVSKLQIE